MARQTLSHDVTARVRQAILDHAMASPGDRILVGLSGGPDSVALARVLMALAPDPDLDFSLALAHLNHSLRDEESLRDEVFAREFASAHGLDLTVETRDIRAEAKSGRLSLEEAGRNARYAFFHKTARDRGCARIALGHHRDDHVEQVLMNLVRGAGVRGLRGIPPVRQGNIIRPLIGLSKADILAYLEEIGQNFVLDSTNQDTTFLRNRVRHDLIPLLESGFNPDITSGLNRLSRIITLEDDYMDARATEVFDTLATEDDDGIALAVPGLIGCHPALSRRVLRKAILAVKTDLRRITHTHILDITELATTGETGKHLDLPGQIRVYKKKGAIHIKKETRPLRELGRRQKINRRKSRD